MGYFQVILAEFRSSQNRSCQETSDISFSTTLVTLTFPYTPLVEVKQALNAWLFRQISELESLKAHVLAWGVRQQQSLQAM